MFNYVPLGRVKASIRAWYRTLTALHFSSEIPIRISLTPFIHVSLDLFGARRISV